MVRIRNTKRLLKKLKRKLDQLFSIKKKQKKKLK